MPRVSQSPVRYRLDLTEQEARVVRRLLEQAEYSDLDNRTAGTISRVLRRIQLPTPQDRLPAKVWIVESEHKEVPGRRVSVFARKADADRHRALMRGRYPGMLEYCDVDEHPVHTTKEPTS